MVEVEVEKEVETEVVVEEEDVEKLTMEVVEEEEEEEEDDDDDDEELKMEELEEVEEEVEIEVEQEEMERLKTGEVVEEVVEEEVKKEEAVERNANSQLLNNVPQTAEVRLQLFSRMGSEAETEVVTRQTLRGTGNRRQGQVEAVNGKDWRPGLTLTLKGFPLPPQAADDLAGCHGSQRLGNVRLASYTNPAKLSPGNGN
ncbi:unnamed protein product [Arctogadus glacialis]